MANGLSKINSFQVKDLTRAQYLDEIILEHDNNLEQLIRNLYGVDGSGFLNQNTLEIPIQKINIMAYGEYYNDTTLSSAIAAIGSSYRTIIFPFGTWNITSSVKIPKNICLEIPFGVILNVSSGKTLTIYSPENIIANPRQQIFSGNGNINFTKTGEVYPQWMGCIGDSSTDDTSNFQRVINWGGIINCGGANYTYKISTLNCISNLYFTGSSTFISTTKTSLSEMFNLTNLNNVTFGEDLTFNGNHGVTYTTGSSQGYHGGIYIKDCTKINIKSKFIYCDGYAIYVNNSSTYDYTRSITINSSRIYNCYLGVYIIKGHPLKISNSDFSYCKIGISIDSGSFTVRPNQCNFSHNIYAIYDNGTNTKISGINSITDTYSVYGTPTARFINSSNFNSGIFSDISTNGGSLYSNNSFGSMYIRTNGEKYNKYFQNYISSVSTTHAYSGTADYSHFHDNYGATGKTSNSHMMYLRAQGATAITGLRSEQVIKYSAVSNSTSFGQNKTMYNTSTGMGTFPVNMRATMVSMHASFDISNSDSAFCTVLAYFYLYDSGTIRRVGRLAHAFKASSHTMHIHWEGMVNLTGTETFRVFAGTDASSATPTISGSTTTCILTVESLEI